MSNLLIVGNNFFSLFLHSASQYTSSSYFYWFLLLPLSYCFSVNLFLYFSQYQSNYFCLYFSVFFCLFHSVSLFLSLCLYVSVRLSVYVCLSLCLSVFLSFCLSVSLSLSLYLSVSLCFHAVQRLPVYMFYGKLYLNFCTYIYNSWLSVVNCRLKKETFTSILHVIKSFHYSNIFFPSIKFNNSRSIRKFDIHSSLMWQTDDMESISPTFYAQLLHAQIPKAQKDS